MLGVFTQNSNSVADVITTSSISFAVISNDFKVSGWDLKIFIRVSLKVETAEVSICLESTAMLSWYRKQGILNVPTGLSVSVSIKS